MVSKTEDKHINTNTEYFIYLSMLFLALTIFFKFIFLLDKGLDFTDESFYILWIKNPNAYPFRVTNFGYIFHPIYNMLNGDIVYLRMVNVLLIYLTTIYAVSLYFKNKHFDIVSFFSVSLAISLISLQVFFYGLVTPNYNTLNIWALLIVLIGLKAWSSYSASTHLSSLLIATGGLLCFLAKPTSAILLVPWFCLFILTSPKRQSVKLIFLSSLFAFTGLLIFFLSTDGNLIKSLHRVLAALELGKSLAGGHDIGSIFRLDRFVFNGQAIMFFLVSFTFGILVFISNYCRFKRSLINNTLIIIAMFLLAIISIGSFISFKNSLFFNLVILVVPLLSIILLFAARLKTINREFFFRLVNSLLVMFLPYVHAFGSNGNYWYQASAASVFWILGSLSLISLNYNNQLFFKSSIFSISFVVLFCASQTVKFFERDPYRQVGPLDEFIYKVEYSKGATIKLKEDVANYFNTILHKSFTSGFEKGTVVVDLSGRSPGVVYLMGAQGFGEPWNLGGYPGSNKKISKIVEMTSCELLSQAWVLTEPGGHREIDFSVMSSAGIKKTDYVEVARWVVPAGFGGSSKNDDQILLRPRDNGRLLLDSCNNLRSRIGR